MFCGIDWAEAHHDIAIVDPDGRLVARQRISDDAAGFADLVQLLAAHGDTPTDPIPVAIETSRGLLVACLRATGRPVSAINPLAVARYRERYSVARKKSDHGDALVLANILRTDLAAHRPLPADTELVRAIAVLARAHQDAVGTAPWPTTGCAACYASSTQRSLPPWPPSAADCYAQKPEQSWRPPRPHRGSPAFPHPAAIAAHPSWPARHRRRGPPATGGPSRQLPAPATLVEEAMGRQALALLGQLEAACTSAEELAAATSPSSPPTPTPSSSPATPGSGR